MTEQSKAFATLLEIAETSKSTAAGLPAQVDIKPHWSGVGFSIFGKNFVAPMGEVTEMLEMPRYTHLPGVAEWVKGLANVRGRLLPLADLPAFFGGSLTSSFRQQRVLVIEREEIYCGLVVDAVYGMQHFPTETYNQSVAAKFQVGGVTQYLQGTFRNDAGHEWPVFSPWNVLRDDRFSNAAARVV